MNPPPARVIGIVLSASALACLAFFHAVSGTWRFSVHWSPHARPGEDRWQAYLQSIREPGTLLVGWRSEPQIAESSQHVFGWTLRKPAPIPNGRASSPETGEPRQYIGGVFLQSYDRPELRFYARYLYLRFWLLETVLGVLLTGVWIPALLGRRLRARAASRPTDG